MARHGTNVKLTDKIIRSLEPPVNGNRLYYDSEVPGFALRVTARAARSFVLNYYASGAERRLTIGSYPAWSVAAARHRAKELRREVDNGRNRCRSPTAPAGRPLMRAQRCRLPMSGRQNSVPPRAANRVRHR